MKKIFIKMPLRIIVAAMIVFSVTAAGISTGKIHAETLGSPAEPSRESAVFRAEKPEPVYSGVAVPKEFGQGLASEYDNDADLKNNPAVLMYDNFTDYNNDITTHIDFTGGGLATNKRWSAYGGTSNVYIDPTGGLTGGPSLSMALREETRNEQSREFYQWIDGNIHPETSPNNQFQKGGYEELYIRYYAKFSSNYAITGSNHQGGGFSGGYSVNSLIDPTGPGTVATPGYRSNGYNKFMATFEWWKDASYKPPLDGKGYIGNSNLYVYAAGQYQAYGDHWYPDGSGDIRQLKGPWFKPYPQRWLEKDKWYCIEFYIKLNTVIDSGEFELSGTGHTNVNVIREPVYLNDGRLTAWIDGEKVLDYPNLTLRYNDALKIERYGYMFHCQTGGIPIGSGDHFVWYDNVVLATEYIGPMKNDPRY